MSSSTLPPPPEGPQRADDAVSLLALIMIVGASAGVAWATHTRDPWMGVAFVALGAIATLLPPRQR